MRVAKLTKRVVDALEPKAERYDVWDGTLPGFMVRVTPNGTKSFSVYYRAGKGRGARKRRYAIGVYGALTAEKAREDAVKQLARVALGEDPAQQRADDAARESVATLGEAYKKDVAMRRKPSTASEYERLFDKHIVPLWGSRRVDTVTRDDCLRLQRNLRATPYVANRVIALVGSFFTFANVVPNPAHGIELFPETARERYLTPEEVARLGDALERAEREGLPPAPVIQRHRVKTRGKKTKHRPKRAGKRKDGSVIDRRPDAINPANPWAVNAIRFLLLSGWREQEALTLKWSYLDDARGTATLPDTKAGKQVRQLGAPVWQLLSAIPKVDGNPYVFVGRKDQALRELAHVWYAVRHAAGLDDVRLHDLRHSFASTIASSGGSLLLISTLLGHKRKSTAERYAHLFQDPVRQVATTAAESLAGWLANGKNTSMRSGTGS